MNGNASFSPLPDILSIPRAHQDTNPRAYQDTNKNVGDDYFVCPEEPQTCVRHSCCSSTIADAASHPFPQIQSTQDLRDASPSYMHQSLDSARSKSLPYTLHATVAVSDPHHYNEDSRTFLRQSQANVRENTLHAIPMASLQHQSQFSVSEKQVLFTNLYALANASSSYSQQSQTPTIMSPICSHRSRPQCETMCIERNYCIASLHQPQANKKGVMNSSISSRYKPYKRTKQSEGQKEKKNISYNQFSQATVKDDTNLSTFILLMPCHKETQDLRNCLSDTQQSQTITNYHTSPTTVQLSVPQREDMKFDSILYTQQSQDLIMDDTSHPTFSNTISQPNSHHEVVQDMNDKYISCSVQSQALMIDNASCTSVTPLRHCHVAAENIENDHHSHYDNGQTTMKRAVSTTTTQPLPCTIQKCKSDECFSVSKPIKAGMNNYGTSLNIIKPINLHVPAFPDSHCKALQDSGYSGHSASALSTNLSDIKFADGSAEASRFLDMILDDLEHLEEDFCTSVQRPGKSQDDILEELTNELYKYEAAVITNELFKYEAGQPQLTCVNTTETLDHVSDAPNSNRIPNIATQMVTLQDRSNSATSSIINQNFFASSTSNTTSNTNDLKNQEKVCVPTKCQSAQILSSDEVPQVSTKIQKSEKGFSSSASNTIDPQNQEDPYTPTDYQSAHPKMSSSDKPKVSRKIRKSKKECAFTTCNTIDPGTSVSGLQVRINKNNTCDKFKSGEKQPTGCLLNTQRLNDCEVNLGVPRTKSHIACKMCSVQIKIEVYVSHMLTSRCARYSHSIDDDYGHKWRCNVCTRTFATKKEIIAHISQHTKEELYKCMVCYQHFRLSRTRAHVVEHYCTYHPEFVQTYETEIKNLLNYL